jgi:ribonucleoside-diphosphate reductase alpha chain
MLDFSESEKLKILNKTELDEVDQAFDVGALRVLAARYLLRDENGMIIESPKQMFERIAILVAISDILHDERVFDINGAQIVHASGNTLYSPMSIGRYEFNYYHKETLLRLYDELNESYFMKVHFIDLSEMIHDGEFDNYEARIKEYYDLMVSKDFLPNTPTLMNAGAPLGQLSACFVLDIQDDMEQIMNTAKDVAMIFKSGGGVGINYSKLRPEGDQVSSTSGVASGPLSFMKVIDAVTGVVKQGGKRRGANMGIMDYNHPDIEKFVDAKLTPGVLENFNVSVGTDEEFWCAVKEDTFYELKNPRNGSVRGGLKARWMLHKIACNAHASAEPGLIFFDNINRYNPLISQKGALNSTNPCGEQALYPYESCNLGSINLANFVKNGEFEWARYEHIVHVATRFLDNIIDVNKYPLERINTETKKTRRIGLGIMGLADCLFKLGIAYNSESGYNLMDKFAERLAWESMAESIGIAEDRGSYPLFNAKEFDENFPVSGAQSLTEEDGRYGVWEVLRDTVRKQGIRNAWTTTIAPTGTLSMIAGCSSGVEPVFGLSFEKHVTVGKFLFLNEIFREKLTELGFNDLHTEDRWILDQIVDNYGSCRGVLSDLVSNVFVTAMDIHWADHIYAEAVWQRWISNAIAKTINLPQDASSDDVRRAYLIAHELGLKGITVYRDGSRHQQVLHITGDKARKFDNNPSEAVKKALREFKDPYIVNEARAAIEEKITPFTCCDGAGAVLEPLNTVVKQVVYPSIAGATIVETFASQLWTQGGGVCSCGAQLIKAEGCMSCKSCGWSACSSG